MQNHDVFGRLRGLGRAASCAGVTALWLTVAELDRARHPVEQRASVFEWHTRRWAKAVLRLLGVRVTVASSPPAAHGPRLIVSNHRTTLDVLVLLSLFGGRFLSRADLAGWPLIGRGAKGAGVIFVDRADRASGAQAIRALRRMLREGRTITVFPEGSTFAGDQVRPFRRGAFVAASGLDVELVPVGLAYPADTDWFQESFASHLGKLATRRRTEVVVCIGEGRRGQDDRPAELAEALRDDVQALTTHARRLHAGGSDRNGAART